MYVLCSQQNLSLVVRVERDRDDHYLLRDQNSTIFGCELLLLTIANKSIRNYWSFKITLMQSNSTNCTLWSCSAPCMSTFWTRIRSTDQQVHPSKWVPTAIHFRADDHLLRPHTQQLYSHNSFISRPPSSDAGAGQTIDWIRRFVYDEEPTNNLANRLLQPSFVLFNIYASAPSCSIAKHSWGYTYLKTITIRTLHQNSNSRHEEVSQNIQGGSVPGYLIDQLIWSRLKIILEMY